MMNLKENLFDVIFCIMLISFSSVKENVSWENKRKNVTFGNTSFTNQVCYFTASVVHENLNSSFPFPYVFFTLCLSFFLSLSIWRTHTFMLLNPSYHYHWYVQNYRFVQTAFIPVCRFSHYLFIHYLLILLFFFTLMYLFICLYIFYIIVLSVYQYTLFRFGYLTVWTNPCMDVSSGFFFLWKRVPVLTTNQAVEHLTT